MKKKLLVFHTRVEIYRVDFFNNLVDRFDMAMCIDNKVDYGTLVGDISQLYRFNYTEFNSKTGLLPTTKFVVKQLCKGSPDIVMVPECGVVSFIVVIYKYLLLKKYKIFSLIDDSFNMLSENNQFTMRHRYAERFLIPRFTNIINVDSRSATFFQQKYRKGFYFPIIRDEGKYRSELESAQPTSDRYIKRYHLEERKVVLYVGRFVELKNVINLIASVRLLKRNDVCLVLIGAGVEEESYREAANGMNVIFTGPLNGLDLLAWYNIANVLVLPSLQEAFGAVVNEALMAGCPCVVSERAGSSSLIKEGINGYVFNPLNVEELSEKIRLVLDQTNNLSSSVSIRPSLMQTTFQEEFENIVNCLDCANYEQ